MLFVMTIIGFIIIIILCLRILIQSQFRRDVKQLFKQSDSISNRIFVTEQLEGLPEPVQRYFKHVLPERQRYISYARITHAGQFKPGLNKNWINIKGEQYATTMKPGFIWKGVTAIFTARDMYINDKGRLIVSLLSLFSIVDAKGVAYNQGELLRWLGESVMYPTNLLPSDRLKWIPINDSSAKLIFNYAYLSLYFIAHISPAGEITQLETERYLDEKHLELWVINMGHYKKLNDIMVPTAFEVLWRLKQGDISYAKFTIRKIEYDIPFLF